MNDLMIDIETLDTCNTAIIVSIAAVEFDLKAAFMNKEFYEIINLKSYNSNLLKDKFSSSLDTIKWWLQQSKEAQNIFDKKLQEDNSLPITFALAKLVKTFNFKSYERIWSKGSNFDFPILEHAFKQHPSGLEVPWHYSQLCDMRTVSKLSGLKFKNNTHNALDDCYSQINQLVEALKIIKGKSK